MNKRIKYLEEHPEKRAEDNSLADAVSDKVFLGFSDTTINHFMLHKVCHKSFYGQSFTDHGFELLQGHSKFSGKILGGYSDV